MDSTTRPTSALGSFGEEIVRIVTPVSACMFTVVLLVTLLNSNYTSSHSPYGSTIATIAYTESDSDSFWDKFRGALLNSLVFVAVVTVATFVMVLLFYLRCTKFLKYYMGFSAFMVLGFMGGEVALFAIRDFDLPIDCITFSIILFNFAVVGVLAVFMPKMAIFVSQSYLVVIGVVVAYWFTLLPEWSTWVLLVAMALYDIAAVLLPGGPLRLLVELAISRDEDIPALVYEARPVACHDPSSRVRISGERRRIWRERNQDLNSISGLDANPNENYVLASNSMSGPLVSAGNVAETRMVGAEEGRVSGGDSELSAPLICSDVSPDSIGLGSSGAIKLGLGDFIFYSVLVGRAAMYNFLSVYACYLAIIAGLVITLLLLAFYQKALPALPVSVLLGVLFYIFSRTLLEVFVVQCSVNLLLF